MKMSPIETSNRSTSGLLVKLSNAIYVHRCARELIKVSIGGNDVRSRERSRDDASADGQLASSARSLSQADGDSFIP